MALHPKQCNVVLYVIVNAGSSTLTVDRMWISTSLFWKKTQVNYDAQWQQIKNLPLASRPKFITIASFNSWEEGNSIESSSVLGTTVLDRSAYWTQQILTP